MVLISTIELIPYLEEEKTLQKCLAFVFVEQPVQGNLHNWIPDISASGRNEGRGGGGALI